VLTAAFNKALASYLKDVQLLGQADQFTEGGQQQDQQKAINGFGSNCGGGSGAGIDCNFAYTMLGAGNGNGNGNGNGGNHNEFQPPPTVEVIACRNVSYMGAPLLTLGSTTFQAVAHSAASVLTAQTQTFTPTAAQQPVEARWYNGTTLPLATAPYEVSFQGTGGTAFAVTVNWYTSVPSNPTLTASKAGSYSCK
jgi:hypothetical protein